MANTDKSYMLIDGDGEPTACIPRHEEGTLLAMALVERLRPVAYVLGARLHLHESRHGRDRERYYMVELHTTIRFPNGAASHSAPTWRTWLATVTPVDILRGMVDHATEQAINARAEAARAVNAAQDAERARDTLAAAFERMTGDVHPSTLDASRPATDVERAAGEATS